MNDNINLYLHGLNLFPGFGPARLFKILSYCKDFRHAYNASREELLKSGIESDLAEKFLEFKSKISLNSEAEKLSRSGIEIHTYKDTSYPKLLLEIPRFPPLLYARGKLADADELFFAVVGTRKITTYGKSVIPVIVEPLVEKNITIVSGMAFGVDSEAHKQATNKNKRTVAVLGGGLDDASLYPKHHQLLAHEILENGGALISEYPIGTPNFKQNFVARNRIISGMSVATLVVECSLDSGSLITARHALEQNRQVYAVPGPIYAPESKGPNNLIKMGAKAVTEASDILDDLNIKTYPIQQEAQSLFGDSPEENLLLKVLSKEPKHINLLIQSSGLTAAKAASALTFLEMKGRVKNLGGQQYILTR